jgi:long-chain acyl-CoA synthetase
VQAIAAFEPEPLVHRATGLLRRHGVRRGDRVLTLLDNSPETFAIGLACQLAGVVQVPLYADLPRPEVEEVAADAEPHLVLVTPHVDRDVVPEDLRVVAVGDLEAYPAVEPDERWPLTRPMSYTSGTTGRRKGVYVGVRDAAWGEEVVRDEHRAFDQRHGDSHLVVSPLHHSGPFRFASVTALLGGKVAILPSFSVEAWLALLRTVRPTSMFCVPTHLHRLLASEETSADDLASLQLLAHAGAPCPAPLKEQVVELSPDGVVWEFYGSTEGQFTVCPPEVWRRARGTVGHPRPGRRLEVRDDDGAALRAGEVGTVWVRAPSHASWQYWRDPDRTADAWDEDWFTVGDLGRLDDDGRLFLAGRPGDLVISGGVNVYPAEVERRLLEHPSVAEAVVFGVPDEEWGERVAAAVVPWPEQDPDPEALRAHAREGLQAAKVPKAVVVTETLPRTSTGKTKRSGLAEHFGLTPT